MSGPKLVYTLRLPKKSQDYNRWSHPHYADAMFPDYYARFQTQFIAKKYRILEELRMLCRIVEEMQQCTGVGSSGKKTRRREARCRRALLNMCDWLDTFPLDLDAEMERIRKELDDAIECKESVDILYIQRRHTEGTPEFIAFHALRRYKELKEENLRSAALLFPKISVLRRFVGFIFDDAIDPETKVYYYSLASPYAHAVYEYCVRH